MSNGCKPCGKGGTMFAKVDTVCPTQPCAPFRLDESAGAFFDHVAQEQVQACGTSILFWHQNLETSIRDPLYDEPIERDWKGPFRLMAYVEYMEAQPSMREEGMITRWDGRIWIPRVELEGAKAPPPLEGDVIQYWDSSAFFKGFSVADEEVPESGYYFDVVKVSNDGHVFDTPYFVGFAVYVLRRTEFTAERRLNS